MKTRIKSICPAIDAVAVYRGKDGGEIRHPILLWAVIETETGDEIRGIDGGDICMAPEGAETASNFLGYDSARTIGDL